MKKGVSIGIDASRCLAEQATGVEFVSRKLFENLRSIKEEQDGIDVIYYSPRSVDARFLDANKHIGQIVIPFKRLWTQVRLSFEMLRRPTQVLFVPSHTLPLIHPRRSAILIHDVAFKHFPDSYSSFQYMYLSFSTWFACKTAAKIFCCSQATADDLRRFYRVDKSRLCIIPHGPGAISTQKDDPKALTKLGVSGNYFVYIGRIEEKKNLVTVIEAFQELLRTHSDINLVLAGKLGLKAEKVMEKINEYNLSSRVIIPGYVSDSEAKELIRNAKALLLISLYEGFGLPILEAYDLGTPVISSKSSSMPEVAGAGALLVDPHNVEEISRAMHRILHENGLSDRLIQSGKKRLKAFSWKITAQRYYEELVKLAFSR